MDFIAPITKIVGVVNGCGLMVKLVGDFMGNAKIFQTMIILLLISGLWLIHRCIKLLRAPTDDILYDLKIQIPHIPRIVVDKVTATAIAIHWDIELGPVDHLKYLVMVNNLEAAELGSKNCHLTGLCSDRLYQIQVIAVNILNNYKSQSSPVYIETCSDQLLLDMKDLEMINRNMAKFHAIEGLDEEINSNGLGHLNQAQLLKTLEAYQHTLFQNKAELSQIETISNEEINCLDQTSNELDEEFKLSNQALNSSISNFKEKTSKKEEVMKKRSKASSYLSDIKRINQLKANEIAKLQQEWHNLDNERLKIDNFRGDEKILKENEISKVKLEIENIKLQIQNNEIALKATKANRKQISQVYDYIKGLVDQWFVEKVFNDDNSLTFKGLDILNQIMSANTSWSKDISDDLNHLNRLDSAWKSNFRSEIKQYVNNIKELELLKLFKDPTYTPQFIEESEASVEFGGEANKLKKRKNRSRSKSQTLPSSALPAVDTGRKRYGHVEETNSRPVASSLHNAPSNQSYEQPVSYEPAYQSPLPRHGFLVNRSPMQSSSSPLQPVPSPLQNGPTPGSNPLLYTSQSHNQIQSQVHTPFDPLQFESRLPINQLYPLTSWNNSSPNIVDRSFFDVGNGSSASLSNSLTNKLMNLPMTNSSSFANNIWDANIHSNDSWGTHFHDDDPNKKNTSS